MLCTLAATAVGVIMIFSATKGFQAELFGMNEFVLRQGIYGLIGLGLMFGLSRLNYRFLESFTLPFFIIVILMLLMVMVAGYVAYGASRWLQLGFIPVQPSELAKLSLIITLAKVMSDHERDMRKAKWFILTGLIAAIPVAIVLEQPDLGTAMMLGAIFLGMAVAAKVRARTFLVTALLAMPAIYVFWNYLMHEYQQNRLLVFLNPQRDLMGEGYNILQARISIGNGGLFGQGYLAGTQSQGGFLKVQYSDFVFSVVAEEFGLIGGLALVALLLILVWRCLVVASRAKDMYGSLIAVGVATWIGMQVFINVGMNIGLMPVTGIPLPFISYGGSSLMSILLGLGLVQSVALRSSPYIFTGNQWSAGWSRAGKTTLRPR